MSESVSGVTPIVQGYAFEVEKGDSVICHIVRRAAYPEVSEQDLVRNGPAFVVRFGDGREGLAYSSELRPWYAT